jgi:hypothetical protein
MRGAATPKVPGSLTPVPHQHDPRRPPVSPYPKPIQAAQSRGGTTTWQAPITRYESGRRTPNYQPRHATVAVEAHSGLEPGEISRTGARTPSYHPRQSASSVAGSSIHGIFAGMRVYLAEPFSSTTKSALEVSQVYYYGTLLGETTWRSSRSEIWRSHPGSTFFRRRCHPRLPPS